MKILTASQMRAADEAAINQHGTPGRVLMERAGEETVCVMQKAIPGLSGKKVVVVTGKGNNAGDGFVIAKLLKQSQIAVSVVAMNAIDELAGDVLANAKAWLACGGKIVDLDTDGDIKKNASRALKGFDVVVDAIFGTGFHGSVTGPAGIVIEEINRLRQASGAIIVAVDIPSGLTASSGESGSLHVEATITVSFHALKIAHVIFPAAASCGDTYVADIGIPAELPMKPAATLVTARIAQKLAQQLPQGVRIHKGTRGHTLVIGGGPEHYGAPKLSANAALRIGAGLVTMALPQTVAERAGIYQSELMCLAFSDAGDGSFGRCDEKVVQQALEGKKSIVIGPGMGTSQGSVELLRMVLKLGRDVTVILDADAINLIAQHRELEDLLGANSILTPHPGEMARICESSVAEVESHRLEMAEEWSRKLGATFVLKGARTVVASPTGELFVNPAACSALATAGSGDVLSGVIGGLASQGLAPVSAATCGVFLHGEAGVKLERERGGRFGIVAGDISRTVPEVLNELLGTNLLDQPKPGHPVKILAKI